MSFTLTLEYFRGWKNISITFEVGKVTLIHGVSGVGKTTLFQAIQWLLYGKLQKVAPKFNDKSTNTRVCLTGPEWSIERLSSVSVRFFYQGKIYNDVEAQQAIEYLFGNQQIWKTCCYISQKSQSEFLACTNKEKMKILNEIAFRYDDPKRYFNHIDPLIANIIVQINQVRAEYEYKRSVYESLPPGQQFEALEERQTQLNVQLQQINANNTRRATMEQEQRRLQHSISQLIKPIEPVITLIQPESYYKEMATRYNRAQQLKQQIDRLPASVENVDPEEFRRACELEQQIKLNSATCARYQVAYSAQLPQQLASILTFLETEQSNKEGIQAQQLQQQRRSLIVPSPVTPVPVEAPTPIENHQQERDSLTSKKAQLEQQLKLTILTCPHCQKPAQLTEGKLIELLDEVPDVSSIRTQLQEIQQRIFRLDQQAESDTRRYSTQMQQYCAYQEAIKRYDQQLLDYQKRVTQLEILDQQLSQLKVPAQLYDPQRYFVERQKYEALKDVIFLQPPPRSSQQLGQLLQLQKELSQRQHLQQELSSFSDVVPTALIDYSKYQEEQRGLLRYQQLLAQYQGAHQSLTKSLEALVAEHALIEYIDPTTVSNELNTLKQQQQLHAQYLAKQNSYYITSDAYARFVAIDNRKKRMDVCRQVLTESECMALEQKTISTINGIVSSVCNVIFPEPIQIELNMFKIMKKSNVMKPQVNFSIKYKGATFDNLSEFSGGEGDRVSLALLLAFNSLNRFPILLLDECFTSLDEGMKELTIETLKTQLSSTMLVIMHDGVKGVYDEDIYLTNDGS